MRYRALGNTGLLVSEIALGTVELGMDYGFRGSGHYAKPDFKDSEALLHAAVETGINLFDTARAYGEAEAIIGRVLPDLNPRPYVTTKFVADASIPAGEMGKVITASVETSLRTLGVESVELLQIHNATVALLEREELFRALERLIEDGKIRFAGASLYGLPTAQKTLECLPMRTMQVPYNFLDSKMADVFGVAQQRRVGVLVRSAFMRGVLTANVHATPEALTPLKVAALKALEELALPVERLAELALRYCLSQEAVSSVLIGVRSVEEVRANAAAAELGVLDEATLGVLNAQAIAEETLVSPQHWSGLI